MNLMLFVYSYMWGVVTALAVYSAPSHNQQLAVFMGLLIGQIAWTVNLRNASRKLESILSKTGKL